MLDGGSRQVMLAYVVSNGSVLLALLSWSFEAVSWDELVAAVSRVAEHGVGSGRHTRAAVHHWKFFIG